MLTSGNQKQNGTENGKEINQSLRNYYDSSLFSPAKGTISAEGVDAYFSHLLEEENERVVIETIFMTSLNDFGKLKRIEKEIMK